MSRQSLNEIFAAYEKKHGVKLEVKYTPVEELQEKLKKDQSSDLWLIFMRRKRVTFVEKNGKSTEVLGT